MSEHDCLLRSILVSPDDDLPRLVYADWLDENGQPERAEFIRVGVELAKCPPEVRADRRWNDMRYMVRQPWDALRRRERELLRANYESFLQPSPTPFPVVYSAPNQIGWGLREQTRLGDEYIPVEFRRGLVDVVYTRLETLIGGECGKCGGIEVCGICDGTGQVEHPNGGVNYCPNSYDDDGNYSGPVDECRPACPDCSGTGRSEGMAAKLFASHPIEKVVITDRVPSQSSNGTWLWSGYGNPPSGVPQKLFRLMYPDRSYAHLDLPDATNCLSSACVAYGRQLAGLPDLTSR